MEKNPCCLYIFGGLPACGKTTVARALAERTGACHLRIDTLEQALIRVGFGQVGKLNGKGYEIACEQAKDQLLNHVSVIADCVNPFELTRSWWRAAAAFAERPFVEVEFVCTDKALHRLRAESRSNDIKGLVPPDWKAILQREYEAWSTPCLTLDTACLTPAESVDRILFFRDTMLRA